MHDCKECGDVGLTLPESGVYPDFCTCDIGHDLNDRAHDYAATIEVDKIDNLVKHREKASAKELIASGLLSAGLVCKED